MAGRVDVTSMDALRTEFIIVKETLGVVDCLVNAAGIGTGGPFIEHSEETINRILGINVSPKSRFRGPQSQSKGR